MLRFGFIASACALLAVMALPAVAQPPSTASTAVCDRWQLCREEALAAAARQDYEAFHDLAWRAIQKGPRRHAELMLLLARAQSLSGRPDDALVMLRRIVELGTHPTEALTSDDFLRVRARPGWPELEAAITALAGGAPAESAPATPAARSTAAVSPATSSSELLRFVSSDVAPSALAFDGVSGRFLFAAREARKVVVVAERSDRPVDLVRAESAAFFDVVALDIDRRRGDLWVASSDPPLSGGAETEGRGALHRLQLVSGRPLAIVQVPEAERPVWFTDLSVAASGVVYVLDARGGRIWRLAAGSSRLEVAARISTRQPVALALTASDRVAYVASQDGIARVDLSSGDLRPLKAAKEMAVDGIESLRWRDGQLIAVQRRANAAPRVVCLSLDRAGTRVTKLDLLDTTLPEGTTGATIAVAGGEVYYAASRVMAGSGLQQGDALGSELTETVVKKVRLP